MEKLSPSAECLLVAFCEKNNIQLIELTYGWLAEPCNSEPTSEIYSVEPTKLEAVRKLCKQLNILCEI